MQGSEDAMVEKFTKWQQKDKKLRNRKRLRKTLEVMETKGGNPSTTRNSEHKKRKADRRGRFAAMQPDLEWSDDEFSDADEGGMSQADAKHVMISWKQRCKSERKKKKKEKRALMAFQSDRDRGRAGGGDGRGGGRAGKGGRDGGKGRRPPGKPTGKHVHWTDDEMRKKITEKAVIEASSYTPAQIKKRAQARRDNRLYRDVPELFEKDQLNGKWACVECRKLGHTVIMCGRTNSNNITAGNAPKRLKERANAWKGKGGSGGSKKFGKKSPATKSNQLRLGNGGRRGSKFDKAKNQKRAEKETYSMAMRLWTKKEKHGILSPGEEKKFQKYIASMSKTGK